MGAADVTVTKKTRALVIARDEGKCVRCGVYVADPDTLEPFVQYSLQHRRARGAGGSKDPVTDSPENLITLCGTGVTGCHGWAETSRLASQRLGYSVPQWQDPAVVPVAHVRRGWAWPSPEGVWVDCYAAGATRPGSYLRHLATLRGIEVDPQDRDYAALATRVHDALDDLKRPA